MKTRWLLLLGTLAGLVSLSASPVRADTVWSGIMMASNTASPTPVPPELRPLEETLKSTFGYNQFTLLGMNTQILSSKEETWSANTKYFTVEVRTRESTPTGYLLGLRFLQQDKLLLETEARLSAGNPLLIRGPQIGDGHLVVALVLK